MSNERKVYLTQEEFDDLFEYSMSVPTGVIMGKKWKRNNLVFQGGKEWFQGEYRQHPDDPNMACIVWTPIVIVGTMEIDKDIAKFEERRS